MKVKQDSIERLKSRFVHLPIVQFLRHKSSYSQTGEDKIVFQYLVSRGIKMNQVTYLDLGSGHPSVGSNTYFFYLLGAKGVLIDPNSRLQRWAKLVRRKDKVITAAVAAQSRESYFWEFHSHQYSTFDEIQANSLLGQGLELRKKTKVTTIGIEDAFQIYLNNFKQSPLTILSIDIEGLDFECIKCFPFNLSRPTIIIIEEIARDIKAKSEIEEHLQKHQYQLYAFTGLSGVYVSLRA